MTIKEYYTREEAAKVLDISTRTLDRRVAKRQLSITRKNGRVLFDKEEVGQIKEIEEQHGQYYMPIGTTNKVLPSPAINKENKELEIKLENATKKLEEKTERINELRYELMRLKEKTENSVPLLKAQNVEYKLENEIYKLKDQLFQAKASRNILLALSALMALGFTIFEIIY